jgi:hypothetical protein
LLATPTAPDMAPARSHEYRFTRFPDYQPPMRVTPGHLNQRKIRAAEGSAMAGVTDHPRRPEWSVAFLTNSASGNFT